jgi:ribosomal-protein-alanine N-acetyltransferase
MRIRNFKESDRAALKEITVICFGEVSSIDRRIEAQFGEIGGKDWAWRKKRHIDDDIAADPDGIFVAEVDAESIGYITSRVDVESRIGSIPNLAVLPAHRGQGFARSLIDAVVAYLKERGMTHVRIETLASNDTGRDFYTSYGFTEVARQIHYIMPTGNR